MSTQWTNTWVPGSGNPPNGLHWMDLYKKVQSLGRAIWVYVRPDEMETYIRELNPRHMLVSTHAASLQEGQTLKRNMVEWTAKYWA